MAWTAALAETLNGVLSGRVASDAAPRLTTFGPGFGVVEAAEFRHSTRHTAASLVAMIGTRSHYLTAPAKLRRAADAAARDLVATDPDLAGREEFDLPYRTLVYRARRL